MSAQAYPLKVSVEAERRRCPFPFLPHRGAKTHRHELYQSPPPFDDSLYLGRLSIRHRPAHLRHLSPCPYEEVIPSVLLVSHFAFQYLIISLIQDVLPTVSFLLYSLPLLLRGHRPRPSPRPTRLASPSPGGHHHCHPHLP